MEDLIAKTKAKVVAEKKAYTSPEDIEAKVKERVQMMMLQIEQASSTKHSEYTFCRRDKYDELAMEHIAKHFNVEVFSREDYLDGAIILERWKISW